LRVDGNMITYVRVKSFVRAVDLKSCYSESGHMIWSTGGNQDETD